MRQIFRRGEDGQYRWFDSVGQSIESPSAFVHDDTLPVPLRHMVNSKITESKSQLEKWNKECGMVCVGNDLVGQTSKVKDIVTEKMVMDRIKRAESILADPDKKRAYDAMNRQRTEKAMDLIGKIIPR